MYSKFIPPLLESTVSVLSTMAKVTVTPGIPVIKKGTHALGDVTGIINLTGSCGQASLAISFSAPAILHISEQMLGEAFTSVDDTIVDIVGEITNMICGNAKRIYSELGMDFALTLPSMIKGNEKPITHSIEGDPIVLPFRAEAGDFYLELCLN